MTGEKMFTVKTKIVMKKTGMIVFWKTLLVFFREIILTRSLTFIKYRLKMDQIIYL